MPGSSLHGRAFTRVAVIVVLSLTPALAQAQEPATPEPVAEGPAAAPAPSEPRPPAVEVEAARRVRHNWYAGFGVGLGVGNLRRTDTGRNALSVALLGQVRAGGRIRDNLLVGGLLSMTLGGARRGQGVFSVLAEVIGYPIKGKGLVLQGAAGLGAFVQAEVTDLVHPSAGFSRTAVGIAFGLGLGYEFWLARRFNLGLMLRSDGMAAPQLGLRAAGTLGLTFTWY
ncbi:hypothetical protein SAMN02745121_00664 [Nannocystis exedens]|uniref:Outer membrane protein beta-barrel domain-containing protein n=1 Tax=Nannocystis exedens TaxID=54 RepID=A0A1I1TEW9_9BACT|nr:hypothetical protein [Nannocystis exedens]PCC66606.1 hypothetical protein NAEX_09195 [Nannocystis exedens]SFD57135.1 hypothetical protein SAMN02745121_00664 [Nannocystis exedens]